jgi:transcription antitermination factor NusG
VWAATPDWSSSVQNEVKCWRDSVGGSYDITAGVARGMQSWPQPVIGDPSQWFAVETRQRFEKKVAAQLERKGFKVFLPLLTERHAWSDREKVMTIPLFPGYAFVHVDRSRDSYQAILRTAGLVRFVSFGGIVAAVPNKQIEDLKLLLQEKGLFALHPFVNTGQLVRIRGGCLNGIEGTLVRNDKEKLVISIQSIQRSLAVEIQGYELELV